MALEINMLSSNGYKVEEIADIAKEYGIKVNWINYSKV
jgi:inosine/xanthosine triphosphate pyrophosphatase family protein